MPKPLIRPKNPEGFPAKFPFTFSIFRGADKDSAVVKKRGRKSVTKKAAKQKSFEESFWDTATKTTTEGCPMREQGGAKQNPGPPLTSPVMGEGEIRPKLIENDLVQNFWQHTSESFHPICLAALANSKPSKNRAMSSGTSPISSVAHTGHRNTAGS